MLDVVFLPLAIRVPEIAESTEVQMHRKQVMRGI